MTADEDYQVEFVFPTLLRQDFRYYTLGRSSIIRRTGYAFGRVLITRTDSGNGTFNSAEIISAGSLRYFRPVLSCTRTHLDQDRSALVTQLQL